MVRHDPGAASRTSPANRVVLLALGVFLSGCAQSAPAMRVDSRANPASLIDSYLMARGMALSYGHSGRATNADITQLVRYDRAALLAVVTAELEPGDQRRRQAEQALQAMMQFTGDNDLRPDPAAMPQVKMP